jgi:hypothetical protein
VFRAAPQRWKGVVFAMRIVARAALLAAVLALSFAGTANAQAEANPNGANCTGVGFSGLATGQDPGFVGDEIRTYNRTTAAPPDETLGVIRRNTQAFCRPEPPA